MPLTYQIIERLSREIPGYNVRPLTFDDFEALCSRDGIVTFCHKMPSRGWYFVMKGTPFIVINKYLSSGHKTFVGYHEYFHHRYHPGGHHYYNTLGLQNKVELQASTMAAIAIIPTEVFEKDIEFGEDIGDKYNIPKYLVDFRIRIYSMYRQLRMFSDI